MIRLIPLVLLSLLIPFPGHSGPISDYICGETNTLPESIESQSWQQVLAALAEERTDSETENGFEGSHTHRLSNGYSASLFYYIPKSYDPAEATPLLMTLHGGVSTFRSAPGKDVLPRWKEWADENGFIVAAPSSNGNNPWWFREGEEHILESLRFLAANYHLDRNRVVLSGASDGATGTFSLGTRFTDLWSACLAWQGSYQVLTNASPLMGGVQPFFTRNAASIPWRITHGELDELYPGASQTGAIKRLDRAGTKVDWEVHPGLGHDTVATIEIEQPLLASWLSGKERDPYPDLIDWTVIDPIRYGRAYWVRVNRLSQWKQDPFTDLPDLTVPVSKPRPTSAIFGIQFDRDYSGRGARVLGVANYSSAQSSGIRGGDIIVGVGDREIENLSDLQSAITGEESESSQRTVRYLRDAGTYTARFNLFPVKAPIPDHSQAGRIRVERSGNQIKIRTHQIGAFEVLISPEEFDLSQEVTISVQGNEKFRGMIRPDSVFMLDEMRERSGDTASVYARHHPTRRTRLRSRCLHGPTRYAPTTPRRQSRVPASAGRIRSPR
ncbi:MAG: PDZ domain-containing protein, partial [Verrucomicrobiota bacterium]